jgi:choline dehydrogenase-like flavoprotein
MATFRLDDDSVAVIIGSGAGGGTLGHALAKQGIDAVCLEAGSRLNMSDIVNDEAAMFPKFTWLDERIGSGDALADFPVWSCKTVGGTTMHWTAACPRLQAHEIKTLSTYGRIEGANLADWPLDYGELERYYDRAEDLMGVTGRHGIEDLPRNNNFKVLAAGARKIGYRAIDNGNMAINSKPRDGRPACLQTGFCTSGCVIGAKWSTLYTEVPKAEATNHYELRASCMAVKIVTERGGKRVRGVQYLDAEGRLQEQRARFVCVAGNVVETTRLLLNSRTEDHPNGLANSSDQLGRNYMRHVLAAVVGVMPGEVAMYKGAQVAGFVRDETRHDPSRGFSGGFLLHTIPFTPESVIELTFPGRWGRPLAELMERYDDMAALLVVGEDVADLENRITLHPTRKDRYGLPVPVVHYKFHQNSLAMREYALEKGRQIYRSLGAEQTFDMVTFPSTHNLGVARMGTDPKTSVCNPWGRTHDVENLFVSDGSVLPSSGSGNPTLTIVALTLRQADHIGEQVKLNAL